MLTHIEVVRRFAQGYRTGKGCNVFIDGDTIYSYGDHFPLAKRIPQGYLVNSDTFSVSTSKHQSYVREILTKDKCFFVSNCDPKNAFNDCLEILYYRAKKIDNARTCIEKYIDECYHAIRIYVYLRKIFGLKDRITYKKILDNFSEKGLNRLKHEAFVNGNKKARKLFMLSILKTTRKTTKIYEMFSK